MSKRNDEDFLDDILEASRRISRYSDELEYDDFLNDLKTQDAIITYYCFVTLIGSYLILLHILNFAIFSFPDKIS